MVMVIVECRVSRGKDDGMSGERTKDRRFEYVNTYINRYLCTYQSTYVKIRYLEREDPFHVGILWK